jgi:hypothetical protein
MQIGDLVRNTHTGTIGIIVDIIFKTDCIVQLSTGMRIWLNTEELEVLCK